MLPALFLPIIMLAAIELRVEIFALLMILFCAMAGLTEPARRGHSAGNSRQPMDAPRSFLREIDGKTRNSLATHN